VFGCCAQTQNMCSSRSKQSAAACDCRCSVAAVQQGLGLAHVSTVAAVLFAAAVASCAFGPLSITAPRAADTAAQVNTAFSRAG
jgi:hypothetical protein